MSWLSVLGGAATSLLAKGNTLPNLPNYGLTAKDTTFDNSTIWALHEGIKRDDSSTVSIFVFDASTPGYGSRHPGADRRALLPLAKNSLKKLRSLRHPDVLKFLDGSETDSAVYIVTEKVSGLEVKLNEQGGVAKGKGGDEWKVWGLSRIVSALKFVNGPGASTHGNLRPSSVLVTASGEWRLGGFEVLSSPRDPSPVLYTYGGLLPDASILASPECSKTGYEALRDLDPSCLDAYQLHLLVQSLFNPFPPAPPILLHHPLPGAKSPPPSTPLADAWPSPTPGPA